MTVIEEALVTYLAAQSSLTALIGTTPMRYHAVRLPQNPTLPAITYQLISTPRVMSHSGYSNLAMPRLQMTIFALSYATRNAVSEALRPLLLGFRGTMSGIRVDGILLADERETFEPITQFFENQLDWIIHHYEA